MFTVPILEHQLESAVATSVPRVVLDLREVEFMDSTGLRVLLGAQAESDMNGHQLTLRQPTPAVRRLMEITRTLERFTIGLTRAPGGRRR